jgi:hypothetical protein
MGENKEQIIDQLNSMIYGENSYDLSDLQDIVGDGDLAEYL